MRLLAVDTAEKSASIALVEDGVPLCESYLNGNMTHSRTLMEMISEMVVGRAGLGIEAIDGFVVAHGPGSFTGLRIGISVVKGLAYAHSKPAAGVSSLDGIAWQFSEGEKMSVLAMMDAKRGEVYQALYRFEGGKLLSKTDERVLSPHKVGLAMASLENESVLLVGSGAERYKEIFQKTVGARPFFAPPFKNGIRASALAHALFEMPERLSMAHDAIIPIYLRRSDAEINYDYGRVGSGMQLTK